MKNALLSATALALCLASPALAAPHDHGDRHGDHGKPAATPATPAAAPAHSALIPGTPVIAPGGGRHGAHHGGNNAMTPAATPTADAHHDHRGGHDNGGTTNGANPFNGRGGNADRTHAGRGHNSAFDALRRVFNAPRHFHHGTYHRPSGWYAHRWSYGEFLPALFFSRNYWIDDYNDFGLPAAPPGTVWIRYGDDALLIDEYTGEVIEVAYGIFY